MRLLIVSHAAHYRHDGRYLSLGPTVREIDYLATIFDEIRHVACLHTGSPPSNYAPYGSSQIKLIGVPPSGGAHFRDKLNILRLSPLYVRTILHELPAADAIHVRCPSNISLETLLLLGVMSQPEFRWVKYAGNWGTYQGEPWSYAFQKWWLEKGLHRGTVSINGRWPGQPEHVYSFPNPSLTLTETEAARKRCAEKELAPPFQLLFAGRIAEAKGAGRVLEISEKLVKEEVPFHLHLAGDGPQREMYEEQARHRGLGEKVTFHGWLSKPNLLKLYEKSHFFILPSASEGWPKVLGEAMAHGVIPIASNVSSIPQILADAGTGKAISPYDTAAYSKAILTYVQNPARWRAEVRAGFQAAYKSTYEHYLKTVQNMFEDAWDVDLSPVQR